MRRLSMVICLVMVLQAATEAMNTRARHLHQSEVSDNLQSALPYISMSSWGPQRSHKQMKDLYNKLFASHYANASGIYSVFPAADNGLSTDPAQIEIYRIDKNDGGSEVLGHLYRLTNPVGRFTVQEPGNPGGCSTRNLSRTSTTSSVHQCRVATNAGFFDPHNGPTKGECIGNLVVSGDPVRAPGTQNANFGLLKNGSFVVGYIPVEMISRPDPQNPGHQTSDFHSLIAGVVMLVKDSMNFVSVSQNLEDQSSQTSGTLGQFIGLVTARTAIGHDKDGNLLLWVSDGRGSVNRGIDLVSLANLLINFGAVNAINLDGGGSSTAVQSNQVVNYPSDGCPGFPNFVTCERAISSVICLKDPVVLPAPIASPIEPRTEPITDFPIEPIAPPATLIPPQTPAEAPKESPQATGEPSSTPIQQTPANPDVSDRLSGGWKAVIILSVVAAVVSLTILFIYIYRNYRSQMRGVPYEPMETQAAYSEVTEEDYPRW